MNAILDLGSELLIDRSQIREPLFRLLLAAVGEPMVSGAAWLVVDKKIASVYLLLGNPQERTLRAISAG
jgi:hypothetical protein